MRRNLKAFLLAVMAVGALSAIGASAAQATEFDCGVNNCTVTPTKDGTGTTAHHVFDAPGNGPITCTEVTFTKTGQPAQSTTLNVTPSYHGCEFLGQAAFVKINGCHFIFDSHGNVVVQCTGTPIEFGIEGCVGTVDSQGLSGVTDSNKLGLNQTIAANVLNIHVLMEGPACLSTGTFTTGRYTTGNTIVTAAEQTTTHQMVDVEWDTAPTD